MSKCTQSSTNLSSYLRFFRILTDMEEHQTLESPEKRMLKTRFTLQEQDLMTIISSNAEQSEIENKLLGYLNQNKSKISQLKLRKSQSSADELSPCKSQTNLIGSTVKLMDQLFKSFSCILHSDVLMVGNELSDKINGLMQIMGKVNKKFQAEQDIDDDIKKLEVIDQMSKQYRMLKHRYSKYMNSLLVLMDEKVATKHIQLFIDSLLEQLLGCDSYSYIVLKDLKMDIYNAKSDKFQQVEMSRSQLEELVELPDKSILDLDHLQLLKSHFTEEFKQHRLVLVKINNLQYFVLHQNDMALADFLNISEEYNYSSSIVDFCAFIIHTIQQIKVQYFSTISLGDTVLDTGLELVRCSKYLLLEGLVRQLRLVFNIVKMPTQSQKDLGTPKSTELQLVFKDTQYIIFEVNSIDMQNITDQRLYNLAQQLYFRYCQFIKQCYEKITFYKFFIRSKNMLMIEFNKQGELKFLSKPITQKLKQQYQISQEQIHPDHMNYKQMFSQNLPLLLKIENHISECKKWSIKEEQHDQAPYEIFIKREERSFKGFTLIFSENEWIRRKTLNINQNEQKGNLRKQLIQSETLDYIKKLEESNPELRNSVISMFMPQKEAEPLINNQQKTPTLVFRKIDKEAVVGKGSFFYKLREEERGSMKQFANNKFNETHLISKQTDSILDSFDFNAISVPSQLEKQRLVWSLLDRSNFIAQFRIPLDKLVAFLTELESQYNQSNNPFHNYDHGIQVMQASHFIIQRFQHQLGPQLLNHQTRFCLVISALCHDVAHTGKTNTYEANSLSVLAIRYHDRIVLEQHHAAVTVKILRDKQTNILCNLSMADFKQFRKGLIHNILSTDMQEHFKVLKEFEGRLPTYGTDPDDLQLLCGMITHTADFNGPARKWPQSRQWSDRINAEYKAQYEEEGKLGYPQAPFMKDLDKINVMAKNEMGFYKVIVRPLYVAMNTFSRDAIKMCLDNLDETIQEWDRVLAESEKQ